MVSHVRGPQRLQPPGRASDRGGSTDGECRTGWWYSSLWQHSSVQESPLKPTSLSSLTTIA